MFYFYLAPLLSTVLFVQCSDVTLETCKCWDSYLPAELENEFGELYATCVGRLTRDFKPCNIPIIPECLCSADVVARVTDEEGTWCLYSDNMKWPCENVEEWSRYHQDVSEYWTEHGYSENIIADDGGREGDTEENNEEGYEESDDLEDEEEDNEEGNEESDDLEDEVVDDLDEKERGDEIEESVEQEEENRREKKIEKKAFKILEDLI